MPNRDPGSYGLLAWVLITAMSIHGGFVKYIIDVRNHQLAWSWVAALVQVAISDFAGLMGAANNRIPMQCRDFYDRVRTA